MDKASVSSNEIERQEILQEAEKLPLPDAVFAIVNFNAHRRFFGPGPHCEAIPLSDLSPPHSMGQLKIWANRVDELRSAAYDVGDSIRSGAATWDDKRRELQASYPGFGHETYEQVIHLGCFQAR